MPAGFAKVVARVSTCWTVCFEAVAFDRPTLSQQRAAHAMPPPPLMQLVQAEPHEPHLLTHAMPPPPLTHDLQLPEGGDGPGGEGEGPPQPWRTRPMSSEQRPPTWPHHAVRCPSAAAADHCFWLIKPMKPVKEAKPPSGREERRTSGVASGLGLRHTGGGRQRQGSGFVSASGARS